MLLNPRAVKEMNLISHLIGIFLSSSTMSMGYPSLKIGQPQHVHQIEDDALYVLKEAVPKDNDIWDIGLSILEDGGDRDLAIFVNQTWEQQRFQSSPSSRTSFSTPSRISFSTWRTCWGWAEIPRWKTRWGQCSRRAKITLPIKQDLGFTSFGSLIFYCWVWSYLNFLCYINRFTWIYELLISWWKWNPEIQKGQWCLVGWPDQRTY